MPAWKDYQEEVAGFFRSLGLKAETDVRLSGARSRHDIDVLVTINVVGFDIKWLIECKRWKSPVSKLHVMALRGIVADLGADRGIILCESGFQSGAVEAANLTNVQVTSLENLTVSARDTIFAAKLREIYIRAEACKHRYWEIPKQKRIEAGLRSDLFEGDVYSAVWIIEFSLKILGKAFVGKYPVEIDPYDRWMHAAIPAKLNSHEDIARLAEKMVGEIEEKLDKVSHDT